MGMSFFSLRTVPGNCWPPLPDAGFGRLWSAYLELDRTQWLIAEELERRQLAQARTLIAHAVEHVSYYRQVFTEANIRVESLTDLTAFRQLPLLSRRIYQERCA